MIFTKTFSMILSLFCFVVFLGLFPMMAFASEAIGFSVALDLIINMIKEARDAGVNFGSAVGIAFVLVQVLMILLRTELKKHTGLFTMLVHAFLSFASLILTNFVMGGSFETLLTDGATLTAFSTLIHQTWKQFSKVPEDLAKIESL